jgi:hypothetical protein
MKVKARVLWSVAAVLAIAGSVLADNTGDAKKGLAKRIEQLKNVVVVYDFKNIPPEGEQIAAHGSDSMDIIIGAERQVKFSYLDGRAKYESKETKLPKPVSDSTGTIMVTHDIAETVVQIVAEGSRELLCGYRGNSYYKGFIMAGAVPEDDDTIDIPLGMRASLSWLNDKSIAKCKAANAPNKDAIEFAGIIGGTKRWTLSAEHGFAPVVEETVNKDGFVTSRIEMSDWRKVGDVWIAYKAMKTDYAKGEDGKSREVGFKTLLTVRSCEIGSKENVPGLYKMKWPDGTIVQGKDAKEYEAQAGKLQPLKVRWAPDVGDSIKMNTGGEPLPDGAILEYENGEKYELKDGKFRPIEPNQ